MAPTDPTAKLRPPQHKALVIVDPREKDIFGVECSAGDFVSSEMFATQSLARNSAGITEHVRQHATPKVQRRW